MNSSTYKWIGTFGGVGYAPFAPGTFGSLAALIIAFIISLTGVKNEYYQTVIFILIAVSYYLGVVSSNALQKEWGSDPQKIVIDEAHGFWISILFVSPTLMHLTLGLILFRFFDISKILGIKKIDQHVKNGHGVMLDDTLAGIYSCLVLHFLIEMFKI